MRRDVLEPAILCVEDEAAVLDAIVRDLAEFEGGFRLEAAREVAEAREIVADLKRNGIPLALALCDHMMPGVSGTDFLIELQGDAATRLTRKVLVTAQAGLDDTVRAVNRAGLHHYIAKPWDREALCATVREQLTTYVLEAGLDPLPYLSILDAGRLAEAIAQRNLATDG